jgi:uncharacterized membrane protein
MSANSNPSPVHSFPHRLTLDAIRAKFKIQNVREQHEKSLTALDRMAVWITERVGTMGFFLIIFAWTVIWTGYNMLASLAPALHWKAFDPFPAFVAYLLISNVIQILLMPLIMVGQNIQGRQADIRAQNDYEINCKAEMEVELILQHLDRQQQLLLQLAAAQGIHLENGAEQGH